jgi:hypothetical protein
MKETLSMAQTNRETVRNLCKSVITRLEGQKAIQFPPRLRQVVADEVYGLIGPFILTEEDLRTRTLAMIGAKTDALSESDVTESAQFKTAKSIVRKNFGDDELNGFYFQKTLKAIAQNISEYVMRSSHIDDVFETDEDLEKLVIEVVKSYRPDHAH